MSHDTTEGEIRPQSAPTLARPTPEVLQGVLVELDAASGLVETMLVHGVDPAALAAVIASLAAMAALLNGGR